MTRILSFPLDTESGIPNEPITETRIALTNAIGDAIRSWLADHPQATREDIEWALSIAKHCIAEPQQQQKGDNR